MIRLAPALVLVAAVLTATGCAEKKVTVSGKVTRGGQPLSGSTGLLVVLVPEAGGTTARPYSAETDPAAGTFRVEGIPAGRYRIAVQQFDSEFRDALGGVYDPGASPLVYEVKADGQVIDIDLPAVLPARTPVSGVVPNKGRPESGKKNKDEKHDKGDGK